MNEMDLTAAESKATYEENKEYILKHTGLKVSNLYIAQVKQKSSVVYKIRKSMQSITGNAWFAFMPIGLFYI